MLNWLSDERNFSLKGISYVMTTHIMFFDFYCRATCMNEHSSRSHAIFIITIECSEVSKTGP